MHAELKDTSNRLVLISPGYNVSADFDKFWHSIQAQGYPNWRLILIDDLSTDNTFDKMIEAAKADSRVYVVRNTVKKYQVRNWFDTIHNYCKPEDQVFYHYEWLKSDDQKDIDEEVEKYKGVPIIRRGDGRLIQQSLQYQVEDNDIIVFFDPDDWFGLSYAFELVIKEYLYRKILCTTARNFCMDDMYNHDAAIYTRRDQLLSTSDHQFSLFTYRAALFKFIPLEHFLDPTDMTFYKVCGDYCITAPLLYMCGPEFHHHLFVDNMIIYNNIRPECDDSTYEKSMHQAEIRRKMFRSFQNLVNNKSLPIYC